MGELPVLPYAAEEITAAMAAEDRRVMLFGPPGTGKSTLAAALARSLHTAGRQCWCLGADPGSPAFGVPGAVTLAGWDDDHWQSKYYAALCTLDAGRFRLPLVNAVQRLMQRHPGSGTDLGNGMLLVDAPGVVRGMAGRELLEGLCVAAEVDTILALSAPDRTPPLLNELLAFTSINPSPPGRGVGVRRNIKIFLIHSPAAAKHSGKRARARQRTARWDAWLKDAITHTINLDSLNLLGAPPPREVEGAWTGRQIAFLDQHETSALGEVERLADGQMTVRLPRGTAMTKTLLIRDAARGAENLLETVAPFKTEPLVYLPPADVTPQPELSGGMRVFGRMGHVDFSLLNGVFGDPLLHLRLRHLGRSLLFDLGDGVRLPARLAHQVTDVFISHAHMDHISGFPWFLRSRLTELPPCRIFGPPGLARNIEGFIHGYLWDRIGEGGPLFRIAELHGDHLRRFEIKPGATIQACPGEDCMTDGVLHRDRGLRIRAVQLDHRTPVLAYALELEQEINVRKDRLRALQLAPGPWLTQLKQTLMAGRSEAAITLPDGKAMPAGALGDELVLIKPGKTLVYATDLADTADNRLRLTTLARNAHTFLCEAPFTEADIDQARRTGHLTARACGEIAATAGVARLVPFHFSRRYSDNPQPLYDEINATCTCLVAPPEMQPKMGPESLLNNLSTLDSDPDFP